MTFPKMRDRFSWPPKSIEKPMKIETPEPAANKTTGKRKRKSNKSVK